MNPVNPTNPKHRAALVEMGSTAARLRASRLASLDPIDSDRLAQLIALLAEAEREHPGQPTTALTVTVEQCLNHLRPDLDLTDEGERGTANRMLSELVATVNAAAEADGVALEGDPFVELAGGKRSGLARRLRFLGPEPPKGGHRRPELPAEPYAATVWEQNKRGEPVVNLTICHGQDHADKAAMLWAELDLGLRAIGGFEFVPHFLSSAEADDAMRDSAIARAHVVLVAESNELMASELPNRIAASPPRRANALVVPLTMAETAAEHDYLDRSQRFTFGKNNKPFAPLSPVDRESFASRLADQLVAALKNLPAPAPHPELDLDAIAGVDGEAPQETAPLVQRTRLRHGDYLSAAKGGDEPAEVQAKDVRLGVGDTDHLAKVAIDQLCEWALTPSGGEGGNATPLLALLGESGTGKTVHSQWLDRRLAEHGEVQSCLFDLRDLSKLAERPRVPTLAEVMAECIEAGWPIGEQRTPEEILASAETTPTVLIFDGLDEVLVHYGPPDGVKFVSNLLSARPHFDADKNPGEDPFRNIKTLVSCRDHFFKDVVKQSEVFRVANREGMKEDHYRAIKLQPLSRDLVKQFLRNALPDRDAEELLVMLEEVHDLTDLLKRPYTLAQVVKVLPEIEQARADGEPVNAASIYRTIVTAWLGRDLGKHQVAEDMKWRLLPRLAAWAWRQSERSFTVEALNTWFWRTVADDHELAERYSGAKQKADAEAKLEEDLRTATFLVRDDADGTSRFRFAHTSFQEFFVADYLLQAITEDRRPDWDDLEPSRETLAFLAELITTSADRQTLVATMNRWRTSTGPGSRLLLRFGLEAYRHGWPGPALAAFQVHNANLDRWRFESVDGRPLNLTGIDLAGCSLRDTEWSEVRAVKANLAGARLDRASLDRVNLSGADLTAASVTGAFFHHCQTSSALGWEKTASRDVRVVDSEAAAELAARGGPPATLHLASPGGHANWVWGVALDAEAGIIVTTSDDQTVRVWDLGTHQQIGDPLTGHTSAVWGVALDVEAGIVVTTSGDRTVRVWDLGTHQQIGDPLTGHTSGVWGVALDVEAGIVVTTSGDRTVRVWDLGTHQQVGDPLTGHTNWVRGVALDAEAGIVVTTSYDRTARLWDLGTHQQIGDSLTGHTSGVWGVALDVEAGIVVTTSSDQTARVWDLGTHQQMGDPLTGHTSGVLGVALDVEAGIVVTTSEDLTARVWDLGTHQQVGDPLTGHTNWVRGVALDAEAGIVVTTSYDRTARLWDLGTHQQIGDSLTGHTNWVRGVALDAGAGIVVTTSSDQTARVWDLGTHQQMGDPLTGHTSGVLGVALDAEAGIVVTTSEDHTARVWDLGTHQQVGDPLTGHTNWVRGVALDAEAGIIVTTSYDQTARVWDLGTHQQIGDPLTGHTDRVRGVALDAGAGIVVTTSDDQTARVWDLETHQQIGDPLTGHTNTVWGVALDAEAGTIVTTSTDQTARVWDLETHQQIGDPLTGHTSAVWGVALDAEAGIIVTTSTDQTARVWDLGTHQQIGDPLTGHTNGVLEVALDAEAGIIVTTSDDQTARVWDLGTRATIAVHRHLPDHGHASYVNRAGQDAKLFGATDNAWRYLFVNPLDAEGHYLRQDGHILQDPYENHLPRLTANSNPPKTG